MAISCPFSSQVSAALLTDAPPVSLRRLAYAEADRTLTLQVETARLDQLQEVERSLKAQGLRVTSGTAVAGDGAAQVDMHITAGERP